MTVFVPVTAAAAAQLRAVGTASDLVGYADGPDLRHWLGQAGLDDEEAGYVALNHAGVAALLLDTASSTRLVLAVESDLGGTDELGGVLLPVVRWGDVQSLFADDPDAAQKVLQARRALRGMTLADALGESTVGRLEDDHDLLWYAPQELDALAERG